MRDYDFEDRSSCHDCLKLNKMITRECGTAVKRRSV
jgi:hypothetical protein